MIDQSLLETQRKSLENLPPQAVLAWAAMTYGVDVVFATSLGAEDQVLTHLIGTSDFSIDAFMLDTGRLFEETYSLLEKTRATYPMAIRVYFPDAFEVETAVNAHGPNFFREKVAWRQRCCAIRKVAPLKRALAGRKAWVTGLRRDQSTTRGDLQVLEWDASNEMVKINPLWNWTTEDVWAFIRDHGVPYNELHDQGFPSIGCAPCTRAVGPDEDLRAGRWWWELPEQKECGLHWENGKLVRNKKVQPDPLLEEVSP